MTPSPAGRDVPTAEQVMELRAARGFVTPIRPVEPGELWCVFAQRGSWEFMVHPVDAVYYLQHGIVLDGRRYPVWVIDEWPLLGAWQIACRDTDANSVYDPGCF